MHRFCFHKIYYIFIPWVRNLCPAIFFSCLLVPFFVRPRNACHVDNCLEMLQHYNNNDPGSNYGNWLVDFTVEWLSILLFPCAFFCKKLRFLSLERLYIWKYKIFYWGHLIIKLANWIVILYYYYYLKFILHKNVRISKIKLTQIPVQNFQTRPLFCILVIDRSLCKYCNFKIIITRAWRNLFNLLFLFFVFIYNFQQSYLFPMGFLLIKILKNDYSSYKETWQVLKGDLASYTLTRQFDRRGLQVPPFHGNHCHLVSV